MLPFAPARFGNPAAMGAAGVVYERTAFVSSSGNDGTGTLNNPALPYETLNAAVTALAVAYSGQTTTILCKTNIAGALTTSADLNTLLAAGLTLDTDDGVTTRTLTSVSFGSATGALLTLGKVTITALLKDESTTVGSNPSAGTITGSASTTITSLSVRATSMQAATGSNGAAGSSGGGADGGAGSDGDPPSAGNDGQSWDASGVAGGTGAHGAWAWNLTLVGSGTIGDLAGQGQQGGDGGNGGDGGSATGGNGGAGGNSTAPEFAQDGAAGGNGGSATANGGDAGNGGNGGAGSTVTKAAGWTISASTLSGGLAGSGGVSAGVNGSATAGAGGPGGSGANGGNTGATGSAGSATAVNGTAPGTNGSDGASGSII